MNTRLLPRTIGLCWCLSLANISADDGFSDLSSTSDNVTRLDKISVQFEVFEVANGKLTKLDEKFDEKFTNHVGGTWFMQNRDFNALLTGRKYCGLFQDSPPDVVDSRPFFHCPVLPSESDLERMHIRTKDDFIRLLGTPWWPLDDYSFSGFFDIRSDGTRFCWVLLEHSSHRLFVGYSKRTQVSYRKALKIARATGTGL